MSERERESGLQPSTLWSVHSEIGGRPCICAWARSEIEAAAKMNELKTTDPDAAETRYFIVRLTRGQVEDYKRMGFIPEDA